VENLARLTTHIRTELSKVIIGQQEIVDQLLIVLACGGHALLEGVPGLAKTLTVKTLALFNAATVSTRLRRGFWETKTTWQSFISGSEAT